MKTFIISFSLLLFGCATMNLNQPKSDLVEVQVDFIFYTQHTYIVVEFDKKEYFRGWLGPSGLADPSGYFLTAIPKSTDIIYITIYDQKTKTNRKKSKDINLQDKENYFLISDWGKTVDKMKIKYTNTQPSYL